MSLVTAVLAGELTPIMVRAWERLAADTAAVPFTHPGWVQAWAGRRRISLITAGPVNGHAAVLPMLRRGGTLATPTDWHCPVFEAAATDDAALGDLAAELANGGAHKIVLGFLDAAGSTFRVLRSELDRAGFTIECRPRMESPFIDLSDGWEAYSRSLPAKKRSDLRRRRRRLEEAGRVTIEVYDGSGNLDALLTEGFAVEAAGWKGGEGTAIASNPAIERLYREAAHWAAGEGWLRLAFLRIDGRPIAFDYCIQDDRRHYLLKTGYDPEYRGSAPGSLLRVEMIERAFGAGLETYEFAGNAEPWKLEWTKAARHIVELTAYAPTAIGQTMRLAARPIRVIHRAMGRQAP